MVELQILNKILKDKSTDILTNNNITEDYFRQYKEEYDFIKNHKKDFGNIPDVETFLDKFPEFEIIGVNESETYLVKTFQEEYLYTQQAEVFEKVANLLQTDSYEALDFLKSKLPTLNLPQRAIGVDIIKQAKDRYNEWVKVKENPSQHFIPSGFEELDEIVGGFHKGEELVVLFARTGQGKTWVMAKILEHSWKMNQRVGLLEPEMSATKVGYRFDTVHKNISNTSLLKGEDIQGYEKYISTLEKKDTPFLVVHPKDFDRKVTVSKLKTFVETNNLDILAIDGISYLTDERKEKGDSRTIQLTNISEDLMDLSIELEIPVIIVCQSNREGAKSEDLNLENIRDSDGIAYNASMVISVQQKEPGLQLALNKCRNGKNNVKLTYLWDIDTGNFEYVPSSDSGVNDEEKASSVRRRFEDNDEKY